jgi:hypothetical protein
MGAPPPPRPPPGETVSQQPQTWTGLSACRLSLDLSQDRFASSHDYVTADCQSASLSWCQTPSGAQDQIFVTVRQLRASRRGTLYLTRGRVCRLRLLVDLANAVILGPSPAGLMTIFCLFCWFSWYILGTDSWENNFLAVAILQSHEAAGVDCTENIASDSSSIVAGITVYGDIAFTVS